MTEGIQTSLQDSLAPSRTLPGASWLDLRILSDPADEEYTETLTWAGGGFDAEEFNVDAVNALIEGIGWGPDS